MHSEALKRRSSSALRSAAPPSLARKRMGSVIALSPRDAWPPSQGADLLELLVAQHRRRERELAAGVGGGLEEVALRPDRGLHRHDDLLADGVDRRVRHLREELLEVGEERLRLLREHRERRVVAHGAEGLGAVGRHGRDEQLHVLLGVAEDLLAPEHGLVVGLVDLRRLAELPQRHRVALEPLAVRVLLRDPLLQLVVGDDAAPRTCRRGTCGPAAAGPSAAPARAGCRGRRPRTPSRRGRPS